MSQFPQAVIDYLRSLELEKRSPAWLLTDSAGGLLESGGDLPEYALEKITIGENVADHAFFLNGIVPLDGEKSIVLECVQTDGAHPADIHVFKRGEEGFGVVFLDASESQKRQQAVQQKGNELNLSYRKLQKEIQKKEVLLHCIIHDLGGPLMGIRGGFELLERERLSDEGKVLVEIGLRQARRQEQLINEILQAFSAEIASLDAFQIDPALAPSVITAAKSAIELLSPAFDLANVSIKLELEGPPALERQKWLVAGEESRLQRVFANLIENGLRYSPAGSTVTVKLTDEGPSVLATIEDQGPGVPAEVQPQLFQKLSQGKRGKGKVGLGLYFCRITVEHWGGEIGQKAGTVGGSCFWFRLPKAA